jgi:MerR family transcriptional regulator, light-induced transcriptional regulator
MVKTVLAEPSIVDTPPEALKSINERFLRALIGGDRARCAGLVREFQEINPSPVALYEHLFKAALYEVGTLWEKNLISVATEHLSTALVEALMNEQYDRLKPDQRNGRTLVAAAVEDEKHQVGIKMVADIFAMHGWDSRFLGAGIPTGELLRYAETVQPDLFALSLSVYFHVPKLEEMLRQVTATFPRVPIVVGGQAFLHGGHEILARYPDSTHLPDLSAVERFIVSMGREE